MFDEPRRASTLIILREALEGMETLLMRRGDGDRFMPAHYVFPGGAVDASDVGLASRCRCIGGNAALEALPVS